MKVVFLDINICLDLLLKRQGHQDVQLIFGLAETGDIQLYMASFSFATMNYMLCKSLSSAKTADILLKLLTLIKLETFAHKQVVDGLSMGWSDAEDAMQCCCAISACADVILTNDQKGFKHATITVMSTSDFLIHKNIKWS